ncbi:hypothetical protein GCM10009720_08700 [Yaniella flava]|uniref:Antitoxin n=1 Tax=Yaniella flava TaxID=287930 RepID=A0ABP5FNN6_9MICC
MANNSQQISITDLRANLGTVMRHAQQTGQRTVVTRNGQPVAALIRVDGLTYVEMLPRGRVVSAHVDIDGPDLDRIRASIRQFA